MNNERNLPTAIHFDLDGTLIDSVPDLTAAINDMCRALGRPVYTENDIRVWVGNGSAILVARALQGSREIDGSIMNEPLFADAHHLFLEAYERHLCKHTRLYPEVLPTLRTLKQLGITLSVITNKPSRFLAKLLDSLKLSEYFDIVVGGDTYDKKKPDPLPLINVCRQLNIHPSQAIMVGDSSNDLIAAQACKMPSIGVTYGYHHGEDLYKYKPIALIDRFEKLLDIVKV